jgi:hypothetical protein
MKIVLLNGNGTPVLQTNIPELPVQPEIIYLGAIAYVRISGGRTYKEAAYLYLNPTPPYV